MPATHDVSIDGAGYMILPGSYRYRNEGAAVEKIRTGVGAFGQRPGQPPGVAIDRDAARWMAVSMMPSPLGIGDEAGRLVLAPAETVLSPALGTNFDTNSRGIIYNGKVYMSLGANLYTATLNGALQLTGWTLIGAAAGVITSMCVANGLLLMACASPAATMSNYAGSGAIANTPAVTAQTVWAYALGIWRTKLNAVNGMWDKISGSIDGGATWTDYELDSAVRSVIPWRGRATGGGVMLLATAGRLWELAGQWVTTGGVTGFNGVPSIIYEATGGGDTFDFNYLCEYQGHVYTWYGGTVQQWDGRTLTPLPGGPRGTCLGMCAAGGYLCVAVVDAAAVFNMVWCYDGIRWFMIRRGGATTWGSLFGTGGLVSDGHLISLNQAAQTVSRWAMPVQGFTSAPRASGMVTVGPLDGGRGDEVKTWTLLAVAWSTALFASQLSAPANPGGNLLIEYSVDDGATFATAGTTVIAAAATSGLATQTPIGGSVQAQRLLVRATWTPTSTYAAFQIDSVYASGWKVGDIPKQERWVFVVKATDKLIKRDGSVDARTGEAQLLALRALAQAGRTFVFQDLDFDLNARSVTGRVLELEETERKGDGTHFLESQIKLTIAAVP